MFRTNKALTAMGPRQVFSSKRQYTMNVAVESEKYVHGHCQGP